MAFKDYRKEEEIIKDYTASWTDEQIYAMTFTCAEVVELMRKAQEQIKQ